MKKDGRIAVTINNDYIEEGRIGIIEFINPITNVAMFYPIDLKPPHRIALPLSKLIINEGY